LHEIAGTEEKPEYQAVLGAMYLHVESIRDIRYWEQPWDATGSKRIDNEMRTITEGHSRRSTSTSKSGR